LMIFGVLAVLAVRRRHRAMLLSSVVRVYENMLNLSEWLGLPERRYATPLEHAQAIGLVLPTAHFEAEQIALLYTRERFGAQALSGAERIALDVMWGKWQKEWRRGMAVYGVEKIAAPFRRIADKLERLRHRIEKLQ
jgi:hypothetical protein